MERKIPFGIKFTRAINLISIVLIIIIAILLACIAVPNFIKGVQDAGKEANPIVALIFGLIILAICSIPAILLIMINKALWNLKEQARVWQIVISLILLLYFPIGTVLHAIVLYFMFFDKETKEAFATPTPPPQDKGAV